MTGLIIIGIIILIGVIILQISKVSELAARIRGEEEAEMRANNQTAVWLMVFMVVFLLFCVISAVYYKNSLLGYGPHEAASAHGGSIDSLFNWTLFFTGVVFILTHIALFYFAYKYRMKRGQIGKFYHHNTALEWTWSTITGVVMIGLVTSGLVVWNDVMPDVDPDEDFIEIEATGYQFAWDLRYPGADGQLGTRNFKLIDPASNPLGQDWTDEKNIDDFHPTEIVLPVNQKVRVRITAKDVLHNFYLPHFRVKMDAIPGLPTYFIFTPTTTTEEYRERLSAYPEWQQPADPEDPTGPQRWEAFEYELACAELCGNGHYSMRRLVKIVSEAEYQEWLASQTSYYIQNVRNTEDDPHIGKLLDYEVKARGEELLGDFEEAFIMDDPSSQPIQLKNLFFGTGSADLTEESNYELDDIVSILNDYSDVGIEIGGHTDNTGDAQSNQILSEARAKAVTDYLISQGIDASRLQSAGYGQSRPVESNETDEGRQQNRRIEMKIISQNI